MTDDFLCSECSYPLRGLPDAGKCPECGNVYNVRSDLGVTRAVDPKIEKIDSVARSTKVHYMLFGLAAAAFVAGALQAPYASDAFYFGASVTLIVALVVMLVYEKLRTGPSWWE